MLTGAGSLSALILFRKFYLVGIMIKWDWNRRLNLDVAESRSLQLSNG